MPERTVGYGVVVAQALRIAQEIDLSPVSAAVAVIEALEADGWRIVEKARS